MKQIMRRSTHAFTLIELLVVIAIISIIAAILFPVFAQAREKARETTCISNLRQIGLGVRAYVQDYDETFPIFHAYNTAASGAAPGKPGHKGVEDEIAPYIKSTDIFKCPDDAGGAPGSGITSTYFQAFGSSYRFTKACYTVITGVNGSYEDDVPVSATQDVLVTDSMFQTPATTRIMRDEMFPWFSNQSDPGGGKYGYAPTWYMQWHPRGGGMVFADGHSKFIASDRAFNDVAGNPVGDTFPTCWWGCD